MSNSHNDRLSCELIEEFRSALEQLFNNSDDDAPRRLNGPVLEKVRGGFAFKMHQIDFAESPKDLRNIPDPSFSGETISASRGAIKSATVNYFNYSCALVALIMVAHLID